MSTLSYYISGLGFKKRSFMHFSKGPAAIMAMHQIKRVFDPHQIMNPYKVLPGGIDDDETTAAAD